MVELNKNLLLELGNSISTILHKGKIYNEVKLLINLDEESFKKLDEELYYRNNETDEEFIPSDDEIVTIFKNLKIIFNKIKKD